MIEAESSRQEQNDKFSSAGELPKKVEAEDTKVEPTSQLYNALFQTESQISDFYRHIDRLELGDIYSYRGNISHDYLVKQIGDEGIQKYYGSLVKALEAKPSDQAEQVYGALTADRIAYDVVQLARVYQWSVSRGLYTSYLNMNMERDTAVINQTNDPETKAKLEAQFNRKFKNPKYDIERPRPWSLERQAHTPSDSDIDSLLAGPETDRRAVLAELIDPWRHRTDQDAPAEERTSCLKEQAQIRQLLGSLETGWQRDLLASSAFRYFMSRNINRPDQAAQAAAMIGNPDISRALQTAMQSWAENSPKSVVARYRSSGPTELNRLESQLLGQDAERLKQIRQKAAELAPNVGVAINLTTDVLVKVLADTHRLLPVSETKISRGNDAEQGAGRRAAEAATGLHGRYNLGERPIYGAVVSTEGELLDSDKGWHYGQSIITLKPEVVRDRATYAFGDTMNLRFIHSLEPDLSSHIMTFDQVAEAKALYDATIDKQRAQGAQGYPYIEAQVLGGVQVEDIASITIPYSEARKHLGLIPIIRQKFPSIELQCNLTPEEAAEIGQEAVDNLSEQYQMRFFVGGS